MTPVRGVGVMPKERIRNNLDGLFDAEVQWAPQPAGHVQLATLMHDPTNPDSPRDLAELVDQWRRNPVPWRERIMPGMVAAWPMPDANHPERWCQFTRAVKQDYWRGVDVLDPEGADGFMRHDADVPESAVLLYDPEPAPPDGVGYGRGLWTTLDRDGINRLIRVLRRARDQAFGRDE